MIAKRLWRSLQRTRTPHRRVILSWGTSFAIDIEETIGRAIWTTGVFDIATSEVLWRLTPRGGICVDVGANIGYMTSIMAKRAARTGHVFVFEPHPYVHEALKTNVRLFPSHWAHVTLSNTAISNHDGMATLYTPPGFHVNQGVASLDARETISSEGTRVATSCLDALFQSSIHVLKLDVEGHESAVLEGAKRLLSLGLIDVVVYEDHSCASGKLASVLQDYGLYVAGIDWDIDGLRLMSDAKSSARRFNESPNFVAMKHPHEDIPRLERPGWELFSRQP